MLHLRRCILARLASSPSASPISHLHRLLSVASPAVSPTPGFAAEEYLVDACGLTRAQALKASRKLSHLKSAMNPDAVLAFLSGLGLSGADVSALVAKDPQLLCASVDTTLAPNVVGLTGLGFSHTEIVRLLALTPNNFRSRSIVSKLQYYMPLLGSSEKLFQSLRYSSNLLTSSLEKVVKPNIVFLQECGLGACDIARLFTSVRWLFSTNPERLQAMVACAEGLGVPRGSVMFRSALAAIHFIGEDKIAAKVDYLKNVFRWSDAEVRIALSKAPKVLMTSNERLHNKSEFLLSEVRLEPAYIARRPVMITYSLEGRIRPRSYVLKFLKEKGLLHQHRDYYNALMIGEKLFVEKFICPHKEAAPHLAEDYEAARRGEVPTRTKISYESW